MPTLKPIPDTDTLEFKPAFVKRYSQLTDWDAFKKYSLCFLSKSIRVNTLKVSVAEMKKRLSKDWELEQIPWCPEGFWMKHKEGRLDLGNTVEHDLGYYYVQEAASMVPPLVLDPQPGDRVLDVAAAPGSKSSQMAAMMQNRGVLMANDVSGARLAALGINLQRMGVSNCVISMMPGERIKELEFDRILLDAPCSGTGTIRKSLKTISMYNPGSIKSLVGLQHRLLANAWSLLRPGGTLVYSTCSLEPDEDEGVIDWFLQNNKDATLAPITLNIKHGPAVQEFEGKTYPSDVSNCLRLWPQDNDTEGFFVAKLVKKA